MGARTKVLDIDLGALVAVRRMLPSVETLHSDQLTIESEIASADVVIGAVLVSGARTPVLVTEDGVRSMQPGSVIVDLCIDQGGTVATSRATSHRCPTFVEHGVIHYCVDNMAGVVPITSTHALTNATLPYIIEVADSGVVVAARADNALARGINVMEGKVTIKEVADATGNPYFPLEYVLPIEYM
jgi:alanine dehydrogenase